MNDNPYVLNQERFSGIFHVPDIFPVALIGAGGIGAVTAVTLAKMGVTDLIVFDDDQVSDVNIATQLHRFSDVGNPKVMGLARTVHEFSGVAIDYGTWRVGPGYDFEYPLELVISAVDSIKARHDIWAMLNQNRNMPRWYIDARMSALEFQMFVVNTEHAGAVRRYEEILLSVTDDDVEGPPCTAKATFFTANMAAAHIGMALARIVKGDPSSYRTIHNLETDFLYKSKLGA